MRFHPLPTVRVLLLAVCAAGPALLAADAAPPVGTKPMAEAKLMAEAKSAAEGTVVLRRAQWAFSEAWSVWRAPQWAVLMRSAAGGTQVVLAPAAAGQDSIIFTGERDTRPLGRAQALTIEVTADSTGGTVLPRLIDAQGHWLIGARRTVAAGAQTLRWEIPGDFTDPVDPGAFAGGGGPALPLRFNDLVLGRAAGEAPLTMAFSACGVEEAVTAAQAITVTIETGSPLRLVAPGGGIPRARLHNRTANPLTLHVELESSGYRGVLGRWAGEVALAADGDAFPAIPGLAQGLASDKAAQEPGIRWLRWRIGDRAHGGTPVEGMGSWAVVAPPPAPGPLHGPGFQYSVCTHTERWGASDQVLEALAAGALGVTSVRTGVGWGTVQPAAGEWRWERMDHLLDLYTAQGIEMQPILGFGNAWADQPGRDYPKAKPWFHPPRDEPWRAYVHGMAEHYRGRIRFWEVWNEADLDGFFPGSTAEYIGLLRSAHEEVHRADPAALVMTAGFASLTDHGGRATNPKLMEEVVGGAAEAFDILAFHQHGSFAEVFQPVVDGPLARLRALNTPAKPLWFNETAVSYAWDSLADLQAKQAWQADELVRKLSFARARGGIGYTWYDLRNDGYDPKDFEHNFGLLTNDFQPKAAFCAYANLIRRMRGTEFVHALDLGQGRHGYLFSAPGAAGASPAGGASASEHVVVLFNQDARMADLEVAATWDAGATVEILDAMGAPLASETDAARSATLPAAALTVTNRPRLLVVHGGAAPRIVPLITVGDPGPALPGRVLTAAVAFTNPFAVPTALRLTWRLPVALGGGSAVSELTVPAHGSVSAAPRVTLPAAFTDVAREGLEGRMEWTLGANAWQGAVVVPLKVGTVVRSTVVDRPADFTLDRQSQVANRFMNDPSRTALLWQGPQDLSAQVWLGHADGALTLHVAVRDAVHHQPFHGGDTWQADGVQIALVVPGQQGWWEFGFARGDDGAAQTWSWRRPAGFADPVPAVQLETTATAGGVDYRVRIPDPVLGLDPAQLAERGLAFNLVVNDDDGEGGRKGWIQIAPGIADNKDPTRFPLVVFAP